MKGPRWTILPEPITSYRAPNENKVMTGKRKKQGHYCWCCGGGEARDFPGSG
ncbi:MAG TPA: hypothetical protein VLL97_04205 [Acidobacteriota bacterium]|nr:hypothetical protein [Acidobacteriota bacterium]